MSDELKIRRCTQGDEAALSLVGQATFLETFAGILDGDAIVTHCAKAHSIQQYQAWLENPDYALWVAEIAPGGAPVGYMVVSPPDLPMPTTPGDLELKRIYLLGKLQGSGLGRRLVTAAVSHASDVGADRLLLGVYAGNQKAVSFYQRMGFTQLGSRKFNVGGKDYDDNIFGMPVGSAARSS